MAALDISSIFQQVLKNGGIAIGLTFGADPELIIVDSNQLPVSAIKAFPGHSKDVKLPIENQSIFYDNVLLEFNLKPARTLFEFQSYFKECLLGASKILKKKNLYLTTRASIQFPLDQCEDDEACIFGCEPEFCIYNRTEDGKVMRVNPPVCLPGNTFRSCGGHIHIGHVAANWQTGGDPVNVVKLMDSFVGIVSVLIDSDPSSMERRKLYGGAGTHRLTSYGLEYRTLSNFWFSHPKLMEIVYKLTRLVIEKTLTNPTIFDLKIDPFELQKTINDGNVKEAMRFYEIHLYKHLSYELQGLINNWIDNDSHSLYPETTWATMKSAA